LQGGPDAAAEVVELTGGGVDYAFEVIGLAATVAQVTLMLRKGGTAVLVGVGKMNTRADWPLAPIVGKELNVIGTLMGSAPLQTFVPELAQLYQDGRLLLDEMISKKIALSQINEGYADLAAGGVARSVITFEDAR
jgi:S-(hydroxymethyl)glutathione dehydrogenase/alcohol dehydrogenase